MLRAIGATTVVSFLGALSFPAAAETTICTPITSIPWTISAPGVYCLNSDFNVTLPSGAAISIDSSNVTLDLNRHSLNYLPTAASAYVSGITLTQQKNVVIKNGSIQGFYIAIALFDSLPYTTTQGNVIEDIAAEGSTLFGLYVEGQGNLVSGNRVARTGGSSSAVGILVVGPDNVVRNNEVIATGSPTQSAFAIYGYGCTGLIVDENRVSGVMSQGSASFGIYFFASSHGIVHNNSVDKADASGATSPRSYGIAFDSSTDNAVVGNRITAFYWGIYASSGSSAQTSGNIVIGGSVPVAGTTTATTY